MLNRSGMGIRPWVKICERTPDPGNVGPRSTRGIFGSESIETNIDTVQTERRIWTLYSGPFGPFAD